MFISDDRAGIKIALIVIAWDDSGWILKIKVNDESELSHLLSHAAYEKQCAEEGH